ncbi:MAG: preprotein translocase subunit YajC [Cryobacterium sp.]|nr:preprotein translocase subunit YajC [Cryobacterium sp.]
MDPTFLIIIVLLVGLIGFQFWSSRKRQKDAQDRLAALHPGVEIMTNFGLYGTLVSMDESENTALVEIAPKTIVKLHRQVILKAVEQPEPESEVAPEVSNSTDDEPKFGERTTKKPSRKKPESTN